ncbi:MAG: hypothetical protein ACREUG_15530 [Steroidobacteraceae bacterium]
MNRLFWNNAVLPAAVRAAVRLYLAALCCELVSFAIEASLHPELLPPLNPEHIPYPAFAFVLALVIALTILVSLGLPGWFLFRATQQRNSGRIGILILTAVVTWVRIPELGPTLQQSLLWGALGYLYSSIEIVATGLLFTPTSNAWFSAARAA